MPTLDERLRSTPALGVGLGFRHEIAAEIHANASEIDWIEVITDQYAFDATALAALGDLAKRFPVVPHGLDMSIGSDVPLDLAYVERVAAVADAVDAPWVSDHLCFTRESGVAIGNLTPVQRTQSRAKDIANKARQVQDRLGRLFIMENITYYYEMDAELSEADFITEVLNGCDCGLLLDLENLLVNATNHRFDPYTFLDRIPLERVVQVHVAGGETQPDIRLDTHSAPVADECLELLTHVASRTSLRGALIERDSDFPDDFQVLLSDVRRTRAAIQAGRAS
jgi:uncharacterized protein